MLSKLQPGAVDYRYPLCLDLRHVLNRVRTIQTSGSASGVAIVEITPILVKKSVVSGFWSGAEAPIRSAVRVHISLFQCRRCNVLQHTRQKGCKFFGNSFALASAPASNRPRTDAAVLRFTAAINDWNFAFYRRSRITGHRTNPSINNRTIRPLSRGLRHRGFMQARSRRGSQFPVPSYLQWVVKQICRS